MKDRVATIAMAVTLVSLVFTAGYNWRRVDELAAVVAKNETDFMRKDVAAEQFKALVSEISRLREVLEKRDARDASRGR